MTEPTGPVPLAGTALPLGDASMRTVFDHAPIGRIVADLDGCVLSVNERLVAMIGYSPAQMLGRPIRDFVPEVARAEVRATAIALLEDDAGTTEPAILRFLHRDGHCVPVSVTSGLLRDERGQPQGWVSLVLDLSENERARVDLERAHVAGLAAAERVRLLQAVATASNEADTVERVAPAILRLVCAHFDWSSGCLVREPVGRAHGDTGELHVVAAVGEYRELADAYPAVPGPDVRRAGGIVVVPLRAGRLAWLFPNVDDLDGDQLELLDLIGTETARVVERESAAAQLRDSESRFRSVFGASPLAMGLTIGSSGTYAEVNDALCKLVGRQPHELIGRSATAICHPDDIPLTDPAGAAAAAAPDRRHRFEMRLLHSSGDVVITETTLAWIDTVDGTPQLLAQIEDITARRTVEEVLRHQAEHDLLTGLANRAQLNRRLASLARAADTCIVLFVDIDGFKLINDTRGHDIGDQVLVGVADRLRETVGPDDLVARFGGDEFIVVCTTRTEAEFASVMADLIERALAPAIDTASGPAEIRASIGIARGKVDPANPQRILQRADAAMYHAKQLGRDRRAFYDASLHRRSLERIRTEAALRTALEDDRFIVHFQPIVHLRDRSVHGVEALVG